MCGLSRCDCANCAPHVNRNMMFNVSEPAQQAESSSGSKHQVVTLSSWSQTDLECHNSSSRRSIQTCSEKNQTVTLCKDSFFSNNIETDSAAHESTSNRATKNATSHTQPSVMVSATT